MGIFSRTKKDDTKKAPAKAKAEKPAAEAKADEPKKETVAAPRETGSAFRVLVRPIVTEKTSHLGNKANQYAFEVAMDSNKIEIRKALKAVYGVDAQSVRVMRVFGKPIRSKAGMARRSAWRKAIVTLKKGERIDLFANA